MTITSLPADWHPARLNTLYGLKLPSMVEKKFPAIGGTEITSIVISNPMPPCSSA